MSEISTNPTAQGTPLSQAQWETVLTALPDALSLKDPKELMQRFVVQHLTEEATLPVTGLSVVLYGEVLLSRLQDVLATAKAGDYF